MEGTTTADMKNDYFQGKSHEYAIKSLIIIKWFSLG